MAFLLLGTGVALAQARDLLVGIPSPAVSALQTSLIGGRVKSTDDFDARGEVGSTTDAVGVRLTYGVTSRTSVSLQGGAAIDPEVEAQGSTWRGHSGFFYGVDLYHELFPTTEWKPGLHVQGGVVGFQHALNRLESPEGDTTLVDQQMKGLEYHAAFLASWKWKRLYPYGGIRMFGSSVHWDNAQPGSSGPAEISGHATGNISVVLGCPVQLAPDWRLQAEGRWVNETAVSIGIHYRMN